MASSREEKEEERRRMRCRRETERERKRALSLWYGNQEIGCEDYGRRGKRTQPPIFLPPPSFPPSRPPPLFLNKHRISHWKKRREKEERRKIGRFSSSRHLYKIFFLRESRAERTLAMFLNFNYLHGLHSCTHFIIPFLDRCRFS